MMKTTETFSLALVCSALVLAFAVLRLGVSAERSHFSSRWCEKLLLEENRRERVVRGGLSASWDGGLQLLEPELLEPSGWRSLEGSLFLPADFRSDGEPGQKFQVKGNFSCSILPRNFSEVQDGFLKNSKRRFSVGPGAFEIHPIAQALSFWAKWGLSFRKSLRERLVGYPNLGGLSWAVWTGEGQGLGSDLLQMYREAGLLPLVALSGQHVSVLLLLSQALILGLGLCFGIPEGWRRYHRLLQSALPLLGASLLTVTSLAAPSILRTLAVALSLVLLRMRLCYCPVRQLLTSSVAWMVVLEPSWLGSISFVLSCGATLVLVDIGQGGTFKNTLRAYFFYSLVMPLCMAPLILFYFGEWSYLSPLLTVGLSWLWNLGFIPLGFAMGFTLWIPQSWLGPVYQALEKGLGWLCEKQLSVAPWVSQTYFSYPRLTVWETLCLLGLILGMCFKWRRRAIARVPPLV